MSVVVQRMSLKERSPFLKTIDVWDERKLLSSAFLSKLRAVWQKAASPQTKDLKITADDLSIAHRPRLIHTDPKLCDLREIASRLSLQIHVSDGLAKGLTDSLPVSEGNMYPCESLGSAVHDPEVLNRLLVSLCSELNVSDM